MEKINALVLILACVNAGFVLSLFRRANGHRPFLIGYLAVACVVVVGSLTATFTLPGYTLPALRVLLVLTLAGTLLWAANRKGGTP